MERIITFKNGVIYGTTKEEVVTILPQLENSFRQRKEFFEYYFDETKINITLEQLDKLSSEFRISIDYDSITIDD
jgi:hypothetical protein